MRLDPCLRRGDRGEHGPKPLLPFDLVAEVEIDDRAGELVGLVIADLGVYDGVQAARQGDVTNLVVKRWGRLGAFSPEVAARARGPQGP
jgi:hypothetical protein